MDPKIGQTLTKLSTKLAFTIPIITVIESDKNMYLEKKTGQSWTVKLQNFQWVTIAEQLMQTIINIGVSGSY